MCDCNNESPFNKLRECWSRHYKKEMQGGCGHCCQGQNSKPKCKGKFGVAYIIDTPTRKCKLCGWEVEFNDTPSQIDNNCKKMMNWITCPPLGECQNNNTNVCCCSKAPEKAINNIQQMCCKSANQYVSSCSQDKHRACGGDCCRKKPQQACCCRKKINQNQCCPKTNIIQKPCCSRHKEKPNCCSAINGQQAYLNSKNKCARYCALSLTANPCCFLSYRDGDDKCCSKKITTLPKCCCQSDSQSSLEDCCCQEDHKRKNKRKCACNCSCSGCKCTEDTKTHPEHKEHTKDQSKADEPTATHKGSHQPSKNCISIEQNKERQKACPRSPYTICTNKIPKKGPDKENIDEELQQIMDIDENEINTRPMVPNKPPRKKVKRSALLKKIKEERRKEMEAIHPKSAMQEKLRTDENEKNTLPIVPNKPPRKKVKRSALLKKIKEERKREMEAIHPTSAMQEKLPTGPGKENTDTDESQRKSNTQGEPTLLQKIKRKHEQEMEAIHPTTFLNDSKRNEDQELTTTPIEEANIEKNELE